MIQIPFIRQNGPTNCGAAALQMVYYAYGIDRRQDDIFHDVSERPVNPDPVNIPNILLSGSQSHKLVGDAIKHGLHGMALRVRNVPAFLDQCDRYSVPALVSQAVRLSEDSADWHCRVFAGVWQDEEQLYFCMRDPAHHAADMLMTAAQAIACSHGFQRAGLASNRVCPIAAQPMRRKKCKTCETAFPEALICAGCGFAIDLSLGRLLGCMSRACSARAWHNIICTACGHYNYP